MVRPPYPTNDTEADVTLDHRLVYPLLSLAGIGCVVGLWIGGVPLALELGIEDGPIETASALLWAAGIACCAIAIRRRAFLPYNWLWLAVCFASLGEETSWFQRYLGYSVPVVEQVSKQSEFNVHNLELFPGASSQILYILGLLGWFLAIPLALKLRPIRAVAARIRFPDPTIIFAASMWVAIAFSYLPVPDTQPVAHAVRETREMMYAFFVLVYVFGFAVRRTGLFRTWPPFVPSEEPRQVRPANLGALG